MGRHFEQVAKLDSLFDRIEKANSVLENELGEENDPNKSANRINALGIERPSYHQTLKALPAAATVSRDDVLLLLNVLLHCADVSNVTKRWEASKKWSDMLVEEFLAQGDLEKANGLPISPFMDRNSANQAQMSVNFIDFIVAPLLAALVQAFPTLLPFAMNLIENRRTWHKSLMATLDQLIETATTQDVREAKLQEKKTLKQRQIRFQTTFIEPTKKLSQVQQQEALALANSSNNSSASSHLHTPAPTATNPIDMLSPISQVTPNPAASPSNQQHTNTIMQSLKSSYGPSRRSSHLLSAEYVIAEESELTDSRSGQNLTTPNTNNPSRNVSQNHTTHHLNTEGDELTVVTTTPPKYAHEEKITYQEQSELPTVINYSYSPVIEANSGDHPQWWLNTAPRSTAASMAVPGSSSSQRSNTGKVRRYSLSMARKMLDLSNTHNIPEEILSPKNGPLASSNSFDSLNNEFFLYNQPNPNNINHHQVNYTSSNHPNAPVPHPSNPGVGVHEIVIENLYPRTPPKNDFKTM